MSQEDGESCGPWDPENYFVFSWTFTALDLWEGGIKTGFDGLFLQQKGHAFEFMTLNNALFQIPSTEEKVALRCLTTGLGNLSLDLFC